MAKQKIQGEGDYEATRRYRKRTDEYLEEQRRGEGRGSRGADVSARGRGHEGGRGGGQDAREG